MVIFINLYTAKYPYAIFIRRSVWKYIIFFIIPLSFQNKNPSGFILYIVMYFFLHPFFVMHRIIDNCCKLTCVISSWQDDLLICIPAVGRFVLSILKKILLFMIDIIVLNQLTRLVIDIRM